MTAKRKLFIQLYSIHGLIRWNNPELGRDADTGGQTKYIIELAKALSENENVEKVELITRQITDKNISEDYSQPVEELNSRCRIVRLKCGGGKYLRKELLWNHLEEFVDKSIKYIKSSGRLPDIIHSHYADAGFVCTELTKFFGIPFVHTGHSLGRAKLRKLLSEGLSNEEIEKRYKISHRIKVEEEIINYADAIITSTNQEIQMQYGEYDNLSSVKSFKVIPPGTDIDKFYPYNNLQYENEAEVIRGTIESKLKRFFMDIDKPLILTLCRPDKRKNISALIKAYGEDAELQKKANLAIFAGIRQDIMTMEENEREVLTEILLLMDKYNLYGKMAIPKRHDTEYEVPELYRIAARSGGVFVNAALTEPFGLTLIEAASTGLPVVATDDGGPKDIIGNCNNGLLIDVSEDQNISKAIKEIISSKKMWNRFSENGIKNVRRYYTWKAHTKKYVDEILEVSRRYDPDRISVADTGRKLLDMNQLIISDIDHTLLGDHRSLSEFRSLLAKLPNETGFGVATGRTVESAYNVLKEYGVQMPIVIVSSVGSEIYYNYKGEWIYSTGWDAHISHLWNKQKIIDVLKPLTFLQMQEKDKQRKFKVSYYMEENKDRLTKIRHTLLKNKIKANVIFSHKKFLDILPYRASKGKAIRYLGYRWNIENEKILVAGDSGNDEEMLKGDLLGVVVANYSEELEKIRGSRRVYFAQRSYAGGIIEGINHYNFLFT
ncbi:MAG: HAD-IIB family hydrolase [Ignavibacteriales bacterium]|nr:MAG: HAD-IIB family hydrolase [Ignavibacteriales bacterium]